MPLSQEKEDDRAGTTAAWMQAAEPHEEYDVMIRQLVRVRIVLGGGRFGAYTVLWRLRATMSKNERISRLAPPTSAPSTSACVMSSWMLSGLTLPP